MKKERAVREYNALLDSRKRLTLRDAEYQNYHVTEYEDGSYRIEPRVLVAPHTVSRRTLRMMDEAVEKLEGGEVSEPIEPDDLLDPG